MKGSFLKKPEAEQFFVGNYFHNGYLPEGVTFSDGSFYIDTPEGRLKVLDGDWIIKGEKYPCKPDVFEAGYEEVRDKNDSEQIEWWDIDMRTWDEMLDDALKDNGESYDDVIHISHNKYENPFWFGRPLDGYEPPGFVVMTKRHVYRPCKVIVERLIKPRTPKNIISDTITAISMAR